MSLATFELCDKLMISFLNSYIVIYTYLYFITEVRSILIVT